MIQEISHPAQTVFSRRFENCLQGVLTVLIKYRQARISNRFIHGSSLPDCLESGVFQAVHRKADSSTVFDLESDKDVKYINIRLMTVNMLVASPRNMCSHCTDKTADADWRINPQSETPTVILM